MEEVNDEDDTKSTVSSEYIGKSILLKNVTSQNIQQLRLLNRTILPVNYNDKFYKDVLHSDKMVNLCKIAYLKNSTNDNLTLVGGICCQVDSVDRRRLCILTLGCFPSYRRLGVGTKLMNYILDFASSRADHFDSIYLHVQTNNQTAIEFYTKFGFVIIEKKQNYYRRIVPPDAFLLTKSLRK